MATHMSCDTEENESVFSTKMNTLTTEMGFGTTESQMALSDANGDINQAIEKLLAGLYNPPPYSDAVVVAETTMMPASVNSPAASTTQTKHNFVPKFLSKIVHANQKLPEYHNNPTAPSLMIASELPPNNIVGLPPPYEKIEKNTKILEWEKEEQVIHFVAGMSGGSNISWSADERCSVCFSLLSVNVFGQENKILNDIVQQKRKFYHNGCFSKKYGPKCSHCCFPLAQPDKDHDLSGLYLKYKNKDYHVECYEKYAGPRCTYCFNVIIEKPNGEFSGNWWIVDGHQEFHLECFNKKMHALWRAKNS